MLWVTGAGSGMGRAIAVAAGRRGWRVALSGRRSDRLQETAGLVEGAGGHSLAVPLDTRDVASISRSTRAIASAGEQ